MVAHADKRSRCPPWCTRHLVMVATVLLLFLGLAVVASYNDMYHMHLKSSLSHIKNFQPLPNILSVYRTKEIANNVPSENTIRETKISKFRQNFMLWDLVNQPVMDDDLAMKKGKGIFMYQCGGFCGGWADQLKGTMFAYVIANLTGRRFKTRYLKPRCGILNYVVPNRVDWYLDESFKLPKNETHHNNHLGDGGMKHDIKKINFTQKFGLKKKYEVILANLQYLEGLMNSSVYKNELSWTKDWTPADFYGAVYKRLFKLSPRLHKKLENILFEALPTAKHRLICIHVRLGHEAFHSDWAKRNSMKNMPKIWSWINNQSKTEYDKIFVTSDSWKVMDSAYEQSFSHKLVHIQKDGDIIHSNKFRPGNLTRICESMDKLFLEHHMLMNCDIFVRGHSGLSVIASAVRGTDEGLYCLHTDGNIMPCGRNNFTTFL